MKKELINFLNHKVVSGSTCVLKTHSTEKGTLYNTYNDTNGQRQCYLTYYDYSEENTSVPDKRFPGMYHVRRHCTFFNKGDEYKQGAILGVLNVNVLKEEDITINVNRVLLKDLAIIFK